MSQKRASQKRLNRTQSLLILVVATVGTALATTTPWGRQGMAYLFASIALGLPGLHGVLNARSALRYYRQTKASKVKLVIELICASLLVLSVFVVLIDVKSLLTLYGSWVLAAIATFPLLITGAIEVIVAVRRKRHQRRCIVKWLLNLGAFVAYGVLLSFFAVLAIIALDGEYYMGN